MKSKLAVITIAGLVLLAQSGSAGVTDPNIIKEVIRLNSTKPEPVLVNGGLMQGAQIFSDRTNFFYGNVGRFAGLDYIQTTMDDKTIANVQYKIGVKKAGTLYLIIDNRVGDGNASDPPSIGSGVMDWVPAMGFTATSYPIGYSEGSTVYQLAFTGDPNVITLYEQNDGSSRAMYAIFAAPAGWNFPPAILNVPTSSQVEPGDNLVINATIEDDDGPLPPTVLWSVQSKPGGSTVVFTPDNTSTDVTISFSHLGDYILKIAAFDGERTTEQTVQVSVRLPTFTLQGDSHLDICNDSNTGPSGRHIAVRSEIRNYNDGTAFRRRIAYYSYDISEFKQPGKAFANTYLGMNAYRKRNQPIHVYGIREEHDNYNLSTGSWNTAPGVQNTPVPPLNSEITIETLDTADLSPRLHSIYIPEQGVWEYSPASAALDEFLNADTNGKVILMFIDYAPERSSSFEIHSRTSSASYAEPETGLKGILIKGNYMTQTWASKPNPAIHTSQSTNISQLSWTNPPTAGSITCDVFFGTAEPNMTDPTYGLDTLATGVSGNSVAIPPGLLEVNNVYYWVVEVHDSVAGTTRGFVWSFDTNNTMPVVTIEKPIQYLWLGNAGDPSYARAVINATVTDDNFPEPYTLLWEQISGPASVLIDPNNVEDIVLDLAATGAYIFKLSADDGGLVGSATTQIYVGATPCDAAKAKPTYVQMPADFNNDCYVDLSDLSEFASAWLQCNVSMDAPCN